MPTHLWMTHRKIEYVILRYFYKKLSTWHGYVRFCCCVRLAADVTLVYSGSFWDAALPYPGNQQFVAAYEKEFNHPPAVQSAAGYAGCQLLIDAIRRTGGLDSERLREALLSLKTKTVFGDSRSMSADTRPLIKR